MLTIEEDAVRIEQDRFAVQVPGILVHEGCQLLDALGNNPAVGMAGRQPGPGHGRVHP